MFNTNSFKPNTSFNDSGADGGSIEFNRISNPIVGAMNRRGPEVSDDERKQFKNWQVEGKRLIREIAEARGNNQDEIDSYIEFKKKEHPILYAQPTREKIEEAKTYRTDDFDVFHYNPNYKRAVAPPKRRGKRPPAKPKGIVGALKKWTEGPRVKRDRAEREKYKKKKESQTGDSKFDRLYREELAKQPTDITEGARQRRARTAAARRNK